MGFFGSWLYRDGEWSPSDPDPSVEPGERYLHLDIHDSDIGTIRYAPAGSGTGVAYLGVTPRTYFEDESASEPTDPDREAVGLAEWGADGRAADGEVVARLRALLAEDEEGAWDAEDEFALDDADVFVELKVLRFLAVLGLPKPPDYGG